MPTPLNSGVGQTAPSSHDSIMEERAPFDAKQHTEQSAFGRPAFAEQYQAVRPRPPEALVDLLTQYARCARPQLVADLGCGTGLSTQLWIDRAERVVGIE